MNREPQPPSKEDLAMEARAAFKGFIDMVGVDTIEDIIVSAQQVKERGQKGVTVPSEDGSYWITADDDVSFRVGDYGPFIIEMDTALATIAEIRKEEQ